MPALDTCRHPDVLVLKTMFSALNTAVESYLGTNICFVALVLDDIKSKTERSAQEGLQMLGLQQVLGTTQTGRAEVRAHMSSIRNATGGVAQVVLAVDYSARWFNTGMYTLDGNRLVDPVLGFVDGLTIGTEPQLKAFETALRNLSRNLPLNLRSPDQLLLYGDTAGDPEILDIVDSVSGSELRSNAYVSRSAFRGVAHVAQGAFEEMDTVDFEMTEPASFGCRWRSRLYDQEQVEL